MPRPTADQLQSAGTDYPEAVRDKYLQLPEDPPAEIAETAETIEREYGTSTPYDAARAIERYLLYDGGFTYDLGAEYRRPETALAEFLGEGRRGFCVQFATSMALVLRQMDIPARFVYGAAQGEEVDEGEYVVRGRNMHTWVEVYFPGVGWYPFDPTPGRGVTAAMQESAPGSEPRTPHENTGYRQQRSKKQRSSQTLTISVRAATGRREQLSELSRASMNLYIYPSDRNLLQAPGFRTSMLGINRGFSGFPMYLIFTRSAYFG